MIISLLARGNILIHWLVDFFFFYLSGNNLMYVKCKIQHTLLIVIIIILKIM